MQNSLTVLVPAHGTRIYRLKGEKRLERRVYEAETAFLHDYQQVANHEALGTAIYLPGDGASGRMFAGWLGHRRSNYLEWRDVYVKKGGNYVVKFRAGSQEKRSFNVEVNGETVGTVSVNTNDWNHFQEFELTLKLKAGSNRIQLYNADAWMPNIDNMTICSNSL
jgi:hypothetical protein